MKRIAVLVACLVFALATEAVADTYGEIDLKLTQALGDYIVVTDHGTSHSTKAAPYKYELSGWDPADSVTSVIADQDRGGFCVDLDGTIYIGTQYYDFQVKDLSDVLGSEMATSVGQLYAAFLAHDDGTYNPLTKTNAGMALSIAIWEMILEDSGTYDVTSGNVTVNWTDTDKLSPVRIANGWLGANTDYTTYTTYTAVDAYGLTKDGVQQQSIVFAVPLTPPFPSPSVLVSLCGLGAMFGLVGWRRRKRSR